MGLLGLCAMFYIPSVKNKMFIDPDKVTMTDYLSGNIDEDNVQTNMRKFMWEDASRRFYDNHELIGSGTGRVQTFFYTEATDARRGGSCITISSYCDAIMAKLVFGYFFGVFCNYNTLHYSLPQIIQRICENEFVGGWSFIARCVCDNV